MFTSVFKRLGALVLAIALVASSFALMAGNAQAQSRNQTNVPGSWGSAILIQNVGTGDLSTSDYSITFYSATGEATVFTPTKPIARGGSVEYYVPREVTSLTGGQYSAMVSSAQPVKAVVNSSTDQASSAPWSAFAYEGVDASDAAPRLFFPGFYKDYFGFRSEIVIQNTGGTAATVQATFYSGATGASTGPIQLGSIAPNASQTYSSQDAIFNALPGGTSSSLYGVIVESTNGQPLAGISNIWTSSTSDYGVGSYNGFTSGSQRVYAAALYNQYFGFVSSLTIQNLSGTAAAAGEIKYSNGTTVPFNIPANQSREYFQPNQTGLPSGNNGLLSADITATSGEIVAIVNIQRKARGSISAADPENPAFGSYSAVSTAATSVSVPAIFNNYFGYFTAVSVQNVGGAAANVTLTYGNGQTWVQNIPAGGTANYAHLPGNAHPFSTTATQTGGTVSSSQPLVVVVQHNTGRELPSFRSQFIPNDFLFALSGFPQ